MCRSAFARWFGNSQHFVTGPCCAILAACLVYVACSPVDADRLAIGALEEIATPATGQAGQPNLTRAGDGTVYLSWIERQPDSTHALRFVTWKNGTLSEARTIAYGSRWFVNWADFPMLAVLGDGTLAAHWLQRSSRGRYSYDVMASTSGDGGEHWSVPVTPHRDGTAAEHGFVSLFPMNNQFGVVWLDGRKYATAQGDDGEMMVRFTTLSPEGTPGADVEIDPRACDCCQTTVTTTSDGPLLAYRDRSNEEIRDIYIARYVNGQWTQARPIHADNWKLNACPVNGPSAASDGKRVAVAWFTAANDSARVFVAFSEDAGANFGAPLRIDDGSPLGRVDVQMIANGALVSWLERTAEGAEIRVRRAQGDGVITPAALVSRTGGERPSGFPHMVVANERVFFAWIEPGQPARLRLASALLND